MDTRNMIFFSLSDDNGHNINYGTPCKTINHDAGTAKYFTSDIRRRVTST